MPAIPLFDIASTLFPELAKTAGDSGDSASAPRARARNRAARWQSDMGRAYAYAAGRAATPQEAAALEKAYEQTIEDGPDFTRYRRGSSFTPPPKVSIDRNAATRMRVRLHAIFKGSWASKEKGKHCGVIQRTTLDVFDALLGLAGKYGQVFPSLEGLAQLSKCCKNTVIAALKELERFGFVTKHRRLKRVKSELGVRVVQDTNAYDLHDPIGGLGAMALRLFSGGAAGGACKGDPSESNKWAARSPDSFSSKKQPAKSAPSWPPDTPWGQLREAWEAT
jgi:hypothetical protein